MVDEVVEAPAFGVSALTSCFSALPSLNTSRLTLPRLAPLARTMSMLRSGTSTSLPGVGAAGPRAPSASMTGGRAV